MEQWVGWRWLVTRRERGGGGRGPCSDVQRHNAELSSRWYRLICNGLNIDCSVSIFCLPHMYLESLHKFSIFLFLFWLRG